jgi:diguanylate cyclase (GGDEF)-like protein/PAS domain S-box-containing protein
MADTDPDLVKVRTTGERVFTYSQLPGGERQVTALGPIKKLQQCNRCHEEEEKVRGVLKLTVSLAELDRDVQKTWQVSVMLIVGALAAIVALIYWVAHRTVVSHIVDFSSAMKAAAAGDLSVRLPGSGHDEIAHMARSFNHMNQELIDIYSGLREEQNKLNTIIQGADSGVVVTDGQQKVVLVNHAAERQLGKSEAQIVREGFLALFDDPAWMQEKLSATSEKGHSGVREHLGRILSVQASTIRIADGTVIGSAALIRDITEEKKLEEQLKQQSITDALTGLFTRRHFDEVLLTEFKRYERYAQPLAVMMLDVDHFKRFNDTHGHECGDRVLIAIGAVLKTIGSPIGSASIFPCRYGGEEMVLVMAGLSREHSMDLAEKIRSLIADLIIDGLHVTVSIGVASVPGIQISSGEDLVRQADDALYVAKENGRNQVRVAGDPLPAKPE